MKTVLLFLLLPTLAIAQTNVSGGIHTNTVWTKTNSPYVVTDNVVVFPGAVLTIEPGVEVRFVNGKSLEIRQARLIAVGTSVDYITFTSNSSNPVPGIWDRLYVTGPNVHTEIQYCNFHYANYGILAVVNPSDSITIKNSTFSYNNFGYSGSGAIVFIDNCSFIDNNNTGLKIDSYQGTVYNSKFLRNGGEGVLGCSSSGTCKFVSCIASYNTTGFSNSKSTVIENCIVTHNLSGITALPYTVAIKIMNSVIDSNTLDGISFQSITYAGYDTVINCLIRYNGIGINDMMSSYNSLIAGNSIEENGIGIKLRYPQTICNTICNNSTYDLYCSINLNRTASNNYWCTTDSATIASKIYDGYDNVSLGLITFLPFSKLQCDFTTGIDNQEFAYETISVSPNPFCTQLSFSLVDNQQASLTLYNFLGQQMLQKTFTNSATLNTELLANGIYFYELRTVNGLQKTGRVIKQ